MSRTDPLCPIAHAACPARQRRIVQFIGSVTLEPAGYHGRAHSQRRLYLVPSIYNISMEATRTSFRTVVGKTWCINSRTCLREYIHNVFLSDKYLIAEFYFKFNQSPFPAHPSRTLQCSTGKTYFRASYLESSQRYEEIREIENIINLSAVIIRIYVWCRKYAKLRVFKIFFQFLIFYGFETLRTFWQRRVSVPCDRHTF